MENETTEKIEPKKTKKRLNYYGQTKTKLYIGAKSINLVLSRDQLENLWGQIYDCLSDDSNTDVGFITLYQFEKGKKDGLHRLTLTSPHKQNMKKQEDSL